MSSSFSTISGCSRNGRRATSGSFFEATASTMPRPVSSFSATWKSTKASPSAPCPSTMPPTPVVADHAPPERVVEVEHQRPARQPEPRRQDRRGVPRQHRQRRRPVGDLRHVPAARVEEGRRAFPRRQPGDVEKAHVLRRRPPGEPGVQRRGHAAPGAGHPGAMVAQRVAAGGGDAELHHDRRRDPAHRRPDAAPAVEFGRHVLGGRVAEGAEAERPVVGRQHQHFRRRGEELGARVEGGVEILAERRLADVERDAVPGRGEPEQRREGVGGPGADQPGAQAVAHPRPGLHRAAREKAGRRRPDLEARPAVDEAREPRRGRGRPAGRQLGAGELQRQLRRRALDEIRRLGEGRRRRLVAPGGEMLLAERLERRRAGAGLPRGDGQVHAVLRAAISPRHRARGRRARAGSRQRFPQRPPPDLASVGASAGS